MSMTSTVSFGAKGQVVIPRKLRTEFEIEEGTKAQVYAENGQLILKPITAKHLKSLRGKYKHLGLMKAFMQGRKEDRARDC